MDGGNGDRGKGGMKLLFLLFELKDSKDRWCVFFRQQASFQQQRVEPQKLLKRLGGACVLVFKMSNKDA